MLRVLFTSRNPHAGSCWEMKRVIDRWDKPTRDSVLTPKNLVTFHWRTMEDAYFHFGQQKTKDNVRGLIPDLPTSFLGER